MTHEELLATLGTILGEIVDEEGLVLTDATTADDVLDWDSTNHVRFIVAIESEFGIRFEADEIGTPKNVGELAALVTSKVAAR